MDPQPVSRSAIPRRGPQLAPIRTDLPRRIHNPPVLQKPRPPRLRPNEVSHGSASERVPLQAPPIKRQSSKTNLKNLFTRNKSARDTKQILSVVGERRESTTDSAYAADTPRSTISTPTVVASPGFQTPTHSGLSRTPSKKEKQKPLHPSTSTWVPPPLFQVYPQAVKHACLSTPNLSAESILRIHAWRTNSNAREETQDATSQDQSSAATTAAKKKREDKEKKHARKISGSISKTLWTKKIFILVTSGCLLQYAGDGNYDRLPEKTMRLGPASAAFASDAIPGKPWVLQISQTSNDSGKVATDGHRGLLSRFGFHSADSRRLTRSLFMVFTNADEMNSWLVALRRAIETLGGKKYVPEAASDDDEKSSQVHNRSLLAANEVRSRSSIRRPSLKDTSQNPGPLQTPTRRSPASSIQRQSSYQEITHLTNNPGTKAMNRRSLTVRTSSDTMSTSTATTQRETETIYENPRDPNASLSSPTFSTPGGPSPTLSLAQSQPASTRSRRRTPTSSSHDRRSMYSYSTTQSDRQIKDVDFSTRPRSLVGDVSYLKSPSPPPRNYSVPSFSRKYTARGQNVADESSRKPSSSSSKESLSTPQPKLQRDPIGSNPDTLDSVINTTKRRSFVYDSSFIRDPTPSPLPPSLHLPESRLPISNPLPLSSVRYFHRVRSPELSLPLQTNTPQSEPKQRQEIQSQQSRPHTKLPKPPDTNSSRASTAHLRYPFSTQTKDHTTAALPRASQTEREHQLLGSSNNFTNRASRASKVPLPNSTMIGAATRQQTPSTTSVLPRLSPRKSMPNLSLGPPVAPPPNCPLPEIPPNIAPQYHPAWRSPPSSPGAEHNLRRQSVDVRPSALASQWGARGNATPRAMKVGDDF